ncbi:DUF1905 domain-containing protein [Hoeflea ulvae]|uniref:DUF1905 domain-containing protein n=1 Tax=Hoeflea ulvae TaxID=2983764 RepID=A0ABT3YGN5_9HYPH|nr:DUF1905 domain-containing protein [Hoeflea ulvae]MCY0095064.1 DUF1905 domain-containing protein [Hoeflea ulvae]
MQPEQSYSFEAELRLVQSAKAAWHFVTVPQEHSHRIRFYAGRTNGFGSIRVRAAIGDSGWSTSLFPDKASGCYLLPVKAAIRSAQSIAQGDRIRVNLVIG